MIKHFCDKCKQELADGNYSTNLKNGVPIMNFKEVQLPSRDFYYCNKCLPLVRAFMTGENK